MLGKDPLAALEALRIKGVVVRLDRGLYTFDDASLVEWFAARFPEAAGGGG